MNCCNTRFCLKCITKSLSFKQSCPYCRSKLTNKDIFIIDDKVDNILDDKSYENDKTKLNEVIRIIKENSDGRFLIFSEYDNSFESVLKRLEEESIIYSKLSGSSHRIKNILNSYIEPTIPVLLLNAKYYGSLV